MPKRTNLFQQVIVIIHSHMAEGATVEESAMLRDHETDGLREVDAAITQDVAGHQVVVQVEATAQGDRADVKWVEAELGKHKAVRTDKLVLVSEAGFSEAARRKAEQNGAIALTPENMREDDPARGVVNKLGSVWPKTYQLTPRDVTVEVELPDGSSRRVKVDPHIEVVASDGTDVGTVGELLKQRMDQNYLAIAEQMGIGSIEEKTESAFTMTLTGWEGDLRCDDGSVRKATACLKWHADVEQEPEFHPIIRMDVVGEALIEATEVPLTHRKLGDVSFAYGIGKMDGSDALLVFTEDEAGGKGTLRLRDESGRDASITSELLRDEATG